MHIEPAQVAVKAGLEAAEDWYRFLSLSGKVIKAVVLESSLSVADSSNVSPSPETSNSRMDSNLNSPDQPGALRLRSTKPVLRNHPLRRSPSSITMSKSCQSSADLVKEGAAVVAII